MTAKISLLNSADFVTTKWSGGLTKQIAIAPRGAIYAQRDFLWRVSSATVELEESTFTSLPDYNRYLSTLEGSISLSHNNQEEFILQPGQVDYFDGGVLTISKGLCRDFNLMLRKDGARGNMLSLNLPAGPRLGLPLLEGVTEHTLVLYCVKGLASVEVAGVVKKVQEGQALLLEECQAPVLSCEKISNFMLAEIVLI